MILSFARTLEPLLAGRKTVTRRVWKPGYMNTWQDAFAAGRLRHKAYDKNPRNGGCHVGWIVMTHMPTWEHWSYMPAHDLKNEGGLWNSIEEFARDNGYGNAEGHWCVVRFRFEPMGTCG